MSGWRPMEASDIPVVAAISDAAHGAYTERADVYAERLCLYPAGCWLLERDGAASGYLVSHPWHGDAPPMLNARLRQIPANADLFYLHDLALLPQARGSGAAGDAVRLVLDQARRAGFERITLTAVNGADAFWRKQGFTPMARQDGAYDAASILMERPVESRH
ncbi:GNAT family N-acetyltransferase [Sphingobium sp. CR2-8]|uniref:GNAT family N-acetyltransferase n=1 Tax=Sphingobium sp. CR2-8 TaxID=1306534 RepID=UPI002DB9F44B|nr:GNAT family N-acetyltransferase [Sphingobium sp. CR2-8]MEC3911114.1 GNAT family N-acetyltransferase [Sphingobium sp. CR2-8]